MVVGYMKDVQGALDYTWVMYNALALSYLR